MFDLGRCQESFPAFIITSIINNLEDFTASHSGFLRFFRVTSTIPENLPSHPRNHPQNPFPSIQSQP